MSILQVLGQGQGYLKAGFLGFPKCGKTYTAALLGVATRRLMKADGPIVFFDTEGGSEYVAAMVKQLTGKDLLGVRSRSFADLMATAEACAGASASVLIVDSVTHPWRELCDSYLAKVNEARRNKNQPPRSKLEFQDWNPIKAEWGKWTDFYLNSKLHIIICGRAGFTYEMEKNEETGRRELVTTGTKMKTETEFGFEPSLLVEMEQESDNGAIGRRATVLGDRFGVIDGKTVVFRAGSGETKLESELKSVADFFMPHLQRLTPGVHAAIDTALKTDMGVDEMGDAAWQRERREKEICLEEIQGEMVRVWPGQSSEEKRQKAEAIETVFGTRSWTKVESMRVDALRTGLERMRQITQPGAKPEPAKEPPPSEPAKTETKPEPPPAEPPKNEPRIALMGEDGRLSDSTVDLISRSIFTAQDSKARAAQQMKALDFLRGKGWLKEGQTLWDLGVKRAQAILDRTEQFIKSAGL